MLDIFHKLAFAPFLLLLFLLLLLVIGVRNRLCRFLIGHFHISVRATRQAAHFDLFIIRQGRLQQANQRAGCAIDLSDALGVVDDSAFVDLSEQGGADAIEKGAYAKTNRKGQYELKPYAAFDMLSAHPEQIQDEQNQTAQQRKRKPGEWKALQDRLAGRFILSALLNFISHSPHGFYEFGLSRVGLDLFADFADMDHDGVVRIEIGFLPNGFIDFFSMLHTVPR